MIWKEVGSTDSWKKPYIYIYTSRTTTIELLHKTCVLWVCSLCIVKNCKVKKRYVKLGDSLSWDKLGEKIYTSIHYAFKGKLLKNSKVYIPVTRSWGKLYVRIRSERAPGLSPIFTFMHIETYGIGEVKRWEAGRKREKKRHNHIKSQTYWTQDGILCTFFRSVYKHWFVLSTHTHTHTHVHTYKLAATLCDSLISLALLLRVYAREQNLHCRVLILRSSCTIVIYLLSILISNYSPSTLQQIGCMENHFEHA